MLQSVDLDQIEGEASAQLAEFFTVKGLTIASEKTVKTNGKGSLLGVPFENNQIYVSMGKLKEIDVAKELESMTRRAAEGHLASLFDPLGLVAEVSMQARLINAKCSGLAWDKPLPNVVIKDVVKWTDLAKRTAVTTQPRLGTFALQNDIPFLRRVRGGVQDKTGVCKRLFSRGRLEVGNC